MDQPVGNVMITAIQKNDDETTTLTVVDEAGALFEMTVPNDAELTILKNDPRMN